MSQLFVLLKYGLSTNYRRRSGRSGRLPSSIVTIAASLLIGLPLGSIFFQVFKVISSFRIDYCDPSTLLMLQWTLLNGLLFLASFVPSLINSFSRNEEIHLLLTFPMKRWTIVAYQMILTLSLQPFAVMMYLFVFPAYVVTHGGNLFLGLIVAFLFVLFMLSFSVLLSCIFGFVHEQVCREKNHNDQFDSLGDVVLPCNAIPTELRSGSVHTGSCGSFIDSPQVHASFEHLRLAYQSLG